MSLHHTLLRIGPSALEHLPHSFSELSSQPPSALSPSRKQHQVHSACTALTHGVQASMSFLSDTVLSGGSTRLHVARYQDNSGKVVRKSRSHGGFLSPLSKLARSSVQSIGEAINYSHNASSQNALDENAGRRQILYLRMKNVGTRSRDPCYHMLTVLAGRDLQRMESRCN